MLSGDRIIGNFISGQQLATADFERLGVVISVGSLGSSPLPCSGLVIVLLAFIG